MNPTYKEYVFDFADLKLISVICNKCKTEVIFDATQADVRMPSHCPCGENYGDFFISGLNEFHKAYEHFTAKEVKAIARIRIRREVNVAEL